MVSSVVSSSCPRLQFCTQPATFLREPVRLVIFDDSVSNLSQLMDGLQPGIQAHVLDPDRDGVAQISGFLQQQSADELTLVAHGFPGGLCLGSQALMLSNLADYEHQIRRWFSGIAVPRLALLADEVAQGLAGGEFISQLSTITGATIRASTRPIGKGHWLTATAKTFKPIVLNTYSATL